MIKNLLLSGAILSAPALMVNAEPKVYTTDNLAQEIHVSLNGKYVAMGDYEQNLSYIWNIDEPETFLALPGESVAYDVANDGTVVGYIKQPGGVYRPCVLENGEWTLLPCHPAVANTAEANCITPDGKIIAGTQFINDPTSEIKGRYYPCIWKKNDDGRWTLTDYSYIKLPDHQGFLTKCLYVNGDDIIIGGRLYCGMGSEVPALIVNGELKFWNEIGTYSEPLIWQGQYGAYDENGKQYFTDDPNDPNIFYYDYATVDGYRDGETGEYFAGEFSTVDAQGNFYGYRTRAFNVKEDGSGDLENGATIYNYGKDEWTDNTGFTNFAIGLGNADIVFANGGSMLVNGEKKKITEELGFTTDRIFTFVRSVSSDGKVLGINTAELHEGTGEYQYFPAIVVLDEPLVAGIDNVIGADCVTIIVSEGRIDVAGAASVAVYDLNGRKVSSSATAHVVSGVYVVKADDVVKKVLVK